MDLGQVFTSKAVADYMVSLFSKNTSSILEPCFGKGAFIDACLTAGFTNIDACELDYTLYNNGKLKYPQLNLFNVDFLNFHPGTLYDGIIMNPPYIRQEKIDDLRPLGITKNSLRNSQLYKKLPSTANLYMYFVLKAISLLKKDGQLIIIFPSTWMDANSGKEFKEILLSQMSLYEKIYVSGDVFEENALVDVIILKLIKNGFSEHLPTEKRLILSCNTLTEKKDVPVHLSLNLPKNFDYYATVRRGLSTGWNKMFINPSPIMEEGAILTDIISSPKNVTGYTTTNAKTDKLLLIPRGATLSDQALEYLQKSKQLLLEKKKPKTLYNRSLKDKEWYTLKPLDSSGIIFGYIIRSDIRFILNTSDVIARDNFYIITPRFNPYLTFALLNNFYTFYQLEQLGKRYGAGVLKIQRYDIEALHFIDINCLPKESLLALENLGKKLTETADISIIYEITSEISKHTNISYKDIVNTYYMLKEKRLEM